jgi:peptidoglycan/xylan/chitin deacetylase (PgdA/CDA1 family)
MLRAALALASRGQLSILIFHRVLAEHDPILPGEPSAAEFDALLGHIKRRFTVLPLADAVARLYRNALPPAPLAITFDDGYADNFVVAAPLLKKHALPATIFVATGYLDHTCMFNDVVIAAFRSTEREHVDLGAIGLGSHTLASIGDRRVAIEKILRQLRFEPGADRDRKAQVILEATGTRAPAGLMMTPDMVRSLERYGVDVGAHTVSHPVLSRIADEDARREIRESKAILESLVGRRVDVFAYPNGRPNADYRGEHVRMVREAGFACAVSTKWGAASPRSDILQLPRFTPWTRVPLKFDWLMLRNLTKPFERKDALCG